MKLKNQNDISREWFTLSKWIHFLRVMFSERATRVLWAYQKFSDIDFQVLMNNSKIWIILDIDECIAPHHWEILPENLEIIKNLVKKWFKIVVFSNMRKIERYEELEELWIKVVTSKYAKPDPRGFQDCLDALGWIDDNQKIMSSQVIMIWDNYLTDWWCINAWISFIKIKPIETEETHKSYWRRIQILTRNISDIVAQNVYGTLNYK